MFSSRLPADLTANPLSLSLGAERFRDRPVLDLTESNPTRVGLGHDPEALSAALATGDLSDYAPLPQGQRETRETVAAYYAQREIAVDPEDIILTASTSEAYAFAIKLFLDPGDELLVPRPSYPLFEHLARLEGIRATQYPLRYADGAWRLDEDTLWRTAAPRARALILVSPNNPTGSYLRPDAWERVAAECAGRNLPVIVDEVFHDHRSASFAGAVADPARGRPALTLVLSGLSKVAGLPQMKLGWILLAGPEAKRREARDRLAFIADAYLSVSTPVQLAAARLLALRPGFHRRVRERVESNEAALSRALHNTPLVLRTRDGGWSAVIDLPRGTDEDAFVLRLLEREGVLAHPGYFYDFDEDGVIVLSLLPEPEVFERGLRALCRGATGS